MGHSNYVVLFMYVIHLLNEGKIMRFDTDIHPSVLTNNDFTHRIEWDLTCWLADDVYFNIAFFKDGKYMCNRKVYQLDYFTDLNKVINWITETVEVE